MLKTTSDTKVPRHSKCSLEMYFQIVLSVLGIQGLISLNKEVPTLPPPLFNAVSLTSRGCNEEDLRSEHDGVSQ